MTAYLDYLDASADKLQAEARALQAVSRADEANFVKIRINIFGVCKTVYETLQRATEPAQFEQAYLAKLRQLSDSWQAAYDKAKMHDDAEKLLIEEIKLKTLQKIKLQYLELRRKGHAGS